MSKITDKLDLEIKALEEAQGLTDAEAKPVASVAADPSASFVVGDNPSQPGPASPPVDKAAAAIPIESPEPEAEEPTQQKRISWKRRYTKLKSHHDASRYRDRTTISDAFAKITTLERELISNRAEIRRLTLTKPTSVADLATPEELNIIGDEGISSIDKITQRAVGDAVAPLKEQLARQEEERLNTMKRQADVAGQEAYDSFLSRLERAVPNFAQMDEEPEFAKYLSDPDPDSGVRRLEHFKKAEAAGDVGRVAYYFRGYEATRSPSATQRLEAGVTPIGQGGSPPLPPEQSEPKLLKASEYREFMTDVTKGRKYKGRQDEAEAIESEYDQAFIEGRVIMD